MSIIYYDVQPLWGCNLFLFIPRVALGAIIRRGGLNPSGILIKMKKYWDFV